jgi:hypothetical protein
MLNPLNPYLWVAVLIALAGLYGAHRWVVNGEVEEARIVLKAELESKAKKVEDELRLNAFHERKDEDAKIASIRSDLERANRLLNSRPTRPNVLPPSSGSSCTGRELYREDGQFLRGEAARAEALIIERDYYYNLYEETRKKLNGG